MRFRNYFTLSTKSSSSSTTTPPQQASKLSSPALHHWANLIIYTLSDVQLSRLRTFATDFFYSSNDAASLPFSKKLPSFPKSESVSGSVWTLLTKSLIDARQTRTLTQLLRHHTCAQSANIPFQPWQIDPLITWIPSHGKSLTHLKDVDDSCTANLYFFHISISKWRKGTMALIIWANVGPFKIVTGHHKKS